MTIGRETTDGAFDPEKLCMTRDGARVTFLETSADWIEGEIEGVGQHSWRSDGSSSLSRKGTVSRFDLVNVNPAPASASEPTFDPTQPGFRTQDGRKVDSYIPFVMKGWIDGREYAWNVRGACSSGMSRDNLVNVTPASDPATHDAPAGADGPGDGGAGEGDADDNDATLWKENVRLLLADDPDVVRCCEGGGSESLIGSLCLTVMRTRKARDRALTPPSTSAAAGGTDDGWRPKVSDHVWIYGRVNDVRGRNGVTVYIGNEECGTEVEAFVDELRPASPGTPGPSATPGPVEVSEAEVKQARRDYYAEMERAGWDSASEHDCLRAALQGFIAARVRVPKPAHIGPVVVEDHVGEAAQEAYDAYADKCGLARCDGDCLWEAILAADHARDYDSVRAIVRAPELARPDAARGEAVAQVIASVRYAAGKAMIAARDGVVDDKAEARLLAIADSLDRLEAAAPTLASAPAGDAGVLKADLLAKAEGQVAYWRKAQEGLKTLQDGYSEDGETYTPIGDDAAWTAGRANGRYSEADWWHKTIAAMPAGDTGGMARAVEIVEEERVIWDRIKGEQIAQGHAGLASEANAVRNVLRELVGELRAALRQADARQDGV